jgi:hypothetical protein
MGFVSSLKNKNHTDSCFFETERKKMRTPLSLSLLQDQERDEILAKPPTVACSLNITLLFIFIFIFFFYYSYVHTRLGSFLPPAPTPSLTTHSAPSLCPPLNTQQKLFCPYL